MRPRIICVGGDGRRRGEGVEGGTGLGVGGRGRDAVLGVLRVVWTCGRRAVLDLLVHAVQKPQVGVLRLEGEEERREKGYRVEHGCESLSRTWIFCLSQGTTWETHAQWVGF